MTTSGSTQKNVFVLLRIIDTIEYSPLSRSAKFIQIINTLTKKQRDTLLDGFAKYLAREIADQVKKAILSQKYAVGYKPLTPKYLDYKKRNKLELGFWRSTDFLVQHVTSWKYKGVYNIGFQKTVANPESKSFPTYKVAAALEFGTKDKTGKTLIPSRPVFRPVTESISKRITYYLDKYLESIDFKAL